MKKASQHFPGGPPVENFKDNNPRSIKRPCLKTGTEVPVLHRRVKETGRFVCRSPVGCRSLARAQNLLGKEFTQMRTEKTPAYRMAIGGIWRLRWKSFIIRLIYGILSIGSLFVGATLYGERIPEETNDILLILLHYDNMLFMGGWAYSSYIRWFFHMVS